VSPRSDAAAEVFSALADPLRRGVVELLAERGTATATQLAADLPVTRQAVAKHLAALGRAGLVDETRAGRETRYRLTPGPLSDALAWMVAVGAEWDERLAALRRSLRAGG
jgi:DNA-binding transcriptional ArsR family regulator